MYGEIPKNHYAHKIDVAVVIAFAETFLGFGCLEDIFGMYTDVVLQDMFRNTYDNTSMEDGDDWSTEEM